MNALAKAIAMGSLLVLSSCTPPPTELSFYNNSGRDLSIPMEDGSALSWMSDSYLNFSTMGSAVLHWEEEQGLILQVADADGNATRYSLHKNDRLLMFRFVSTARGADPGRQREPAYVTYEPMHACFQIRLEADMTLHWMGRTCGKIVLKDATPPKQLDGFPLRHIDPPPPYTPDPRSVRL